jgi:hypothetical protein
MKLKRIMLHRKKPRILVTTTHIRDYLVTHAKYPIAGSYMEEDVIVVKHHDLQMWGPSFSSTISYIVSIAVETFTNSVTYCKEDGLQVLKRKTLVAIRRRRKLLNLKTTTTTTMTCELI